MRFALALLLCLLTTTAPAQTSREDHGIYAAAMVVHALDWSQTQTISWECHNHFVRWETNPLLGRCPSRADVNTYFISTALIMSAAHYALPEKYSYWTDRMWLAVGIGAVSNNIRLGIKFSF